VVEAWKSANIVIRAICVKIKVKISVNNLGKKRKSRGRAKGGKGRSELVQCNSCGSMVPRDKAKKVTTWVSFVDAALARELKAKGTYIPREQVTKYYCVSCAVHRGVVKVRARAERRIPKPIT
jgi:small subunit ribosomal protein S26e